MLAAALAATSLLATGATAFAASRTPIASFSTRSASAPLVLIATATSTPGTTYAWTFGDGGTGTGASARHRYATAGSYAVSLTETAADGTTATSTAQALAVGPGSVTLTTPTVPAAYGGAAALSGVLSPAVADQKVRIEANRSGHWVVVALATTDTTGAFRANLLARRPDTLRARWKGTSGAFHTAQSDPVQLAVKPAVRLDTAAATIYGDVTAGGSVKPALPGSQIAVTITQGTKQIGQQQVVVGKDSRFHFSVAAPGKGVYTLQVTLPATGSFAPGATSTKVHARFPELRYGMTEPAVGVLRRRLRALGYRSSVTGNEFGSDLMDAVLAFQKVQGLERTGGVGPALWSALDTPKLPHLRYPGQGDHLEVDKTLQVLMVAHAGKVVWISAVSTGGPGKYTPEGTFTVQRKVPGFDPSPLGTLWDPMYFTGGYAVHGNPSVPAYPASHGCVRVPMWVGSLLYAAVPVGEPVDVYES
jgi:PKD repeat protein